jgi:hypothetical protein
VGVTRPVTGLYQSSSSPSSSSDELLELLLDELELLLLELLLLALLDVFDEVLLLVLLESLGSPAGMRSPGSRSTKLQVPLPDLEQRHVVFDLSQDLIGIRIAQPVVPTDVAGVRIHQHQMATILVGERQQKPSICRTRPVPGLSSAVSVTLRCHSSEPSSRSNAATFNSDPVLRGNVEAVSQKLHTKGLPLDHSRPPQPTRCLPRSHRPKH